jgi:hypothetical protein
VIWRGPPLLLLEIEELLEVVGGAGYGAGERELGDVVSEDAVDLVELCGGERLLRLDDFDVVGDAGLEALAGESEGFRGDLKVALG